VIRCFVLGSLTLGDPAGRCFSLLCATNVPQGCWVEIGAEPSCTGASAARGMSPGYFAFSGCHGRSASRKP
jgi:hypothetical protein